MGLTSVIAVVKIITLPNVVLKIPQAIIARKRDILSLNEKARKSVHSSNPPSSQQGKQRVHALDAEQSDKEQDIYPLFAVSPTGQQNPYMVTGGLNGLEIKQELDTGAPLSVIDEDVYNQLNNIEGSPLKLQDTKLTLKSYTGEIIPVLGHCQLKSSIRICVSTYLSLLLKARYLVSLVEIGCSM